MNLPSYRGNYKQQIHKQTLEAILNKKCQASVKKQLLKSFKKQLQIQHQAHLKEHQQSKIKASRQPKRCESTVCSSVLLDSQSRMSELSAVNHIENYEQSALLSACEYFEMRAQFNIILNELQNDMKKTCCFYENSMKKKTVKNMQVINLKIADVMEEIKKLKCSLSIVCEIINDNCKVLRVKNYLMKKLIPPTRKKQNNKLENKKSKQAFILEENDQNNNQILVNL